MTYRVEFSRPAGRQFRKLPRSVQVRLGAKIAVLGEDPRPVGSEKLEGEQDLYRIQVGDYRVIYQVRDQVLSVLVVKIGHRRDVYRSLGA